MGELPIMEIKNQVLKAKFFTARCQCHSGFKNLNFGFEKLREIKAIFENTPACLSGTMVGNYVLTNKWGGGGVNISLHCRFNRGGFS